jgi:acylphosphatase
MPEKGRIHVFIGGRVHGVAFRFFAEKWAGIHGLTGWVRNLDDGRVEVTAEGGRADLAAFVERLRQGPRMALVEEFDLRSEDYSGEFPDFRVLFS